MILNDHLICFPVIQDKGLDSKLSKHFGRAPFHLLANIKTEETELLIKLPTDQGEQQCCGKEQRGDRSGSVHFDPNHKQCQPVKALLNKHVSAVFCQGFGRKAYDQLISHGISVWITQADTVGEALQDWKDGKIRPVLEDQLSDILPHSR